MFTVSPYGPVDTPMKMDSLARWFTSSEFDAWYRQVSKRRHPMLYHPLIRVFRTSDCRPWKTYGHGIYFTCKRPFNKTLAVKMPLDIHNLESYFAQPASQAWIQASRAYGGVLQAPGIIGQITFPRNSVDI